MTGPVYHYDLIQGSAAWLKARCGLLTASEMKLIVTPTLKAASNDKERAHLYSLLAQRVAGYSDCGDFQSFDMLRGHEDEVEARIQYAANYSPVEECAFITNDRFGFTLGYSPDGLVGADGLIEAKSRKHKFQVETILDHVGKNTCPDEFVIQVQTALLVSERKWCDFISYSAGLPMVTIRVEPDPDVQEAIVEAATAFEARLASRLKDFQHVMSSDARLIATERRLDREITI
jgi:hypothetical protein